MYVLSVFLPLISFVICIIFNQKLESKKIEFSVSFILILATLLSGFSFISILGDKPEEIVGLGEWIVSGGLFIDWSLKFNTLSALMVLVVNLE